MFKRKVLITILIVTMLCLNSCIKYKTTDMQKYGEFMDSKYVTIGDLRVFPENIDEADKVNSYVFDYSDAILNSKVQIFLDVIYSEQAYNAELNRIKALESNNPDSISDKVDYNEVDFSYPAYVVCFSKNKLYEYAIPIDEEYRIVYVYLEYYPEKNIGFDSKFLPLVYQKTGDG